MEVLMLTREFRPIAMLSVIFIFIVIAYALSTGPVFDYANKNPDAIDSPAAQIIFKAYIPLYKIAPDATSWYVGRYAHLSDIETYFLMHQEEFSPSSPTGSK